jgi:hypothetical protein
MIDQIIQPEILNDEFYETIQKYASRQDLKTFLEIGSSSGRGSTEAFYNGMKSRSDISEIRLFCMEVSRIRFKALINHYLNDDFVRCYNISSIALNEFPNNEEVINFYNSTKTTLNNYSIETVLDWLQNDISYIQKSGCDINGIEVIKNANQIKHFDMVLIDGSEFTGERELHHIFGSKVIALDDVNAFKCWNAYQILLHTTHYELKIHNFNLRNGYAIFEKKF